MSSDEQTRKPLIASENCDETRKQKEEVKVAQNPGKKSRLIIQDCCKDKFCWIFLGLFLILVALWVAFVRYLYLSQPTNPFRFRVDSLTVSPLTSAVANTNGRSGNSFEYGPPRFAELNLTLSITNKETGMYESLTVAVEYEGELLSSTLIKPFYQERGCRKLPVRMDVHFDDMAKDPAPEFTIKIRGHYWTLESNRKYKCFMNVACKGIRVQFLSPSSINMTMTNPPIACKFTSPDCGLVPFS